MIEPAEANIVSPAVTTDDPDDFLDKFVGQAEQAQATVT
jgi:hypothetical protein